MRHEALDLAFRGHLRERIGYGEENLRCFGVEIQYEQDTNHAKDKDNRKYSYVPLQLRTLDEQTSHSSHVPIPTLIG